MYSSRVNWSSTSYTSSLGSMDNGGSDVNVSDSTVLLILGIFLSMDTVLRYSLASRVAS